VLYVTAGLLGGIAFFPLMILRYSEGVRAPEFRRELRFDRLLARLFLAAFAGGLCYLLVKSSLYTKVFSIDAQAGQTNVSPSGSLHEGSVILAVVAGLFLSAFYERLERLFRRDGGNT